MKRTPTDTTTVTAEVVEVSPEMAEKWLTENTNNRHLNEQRILTYIGAIERGEWQLNGETIKFSKTNRLLDGQQRLHAIMRHGSSVPTVVVKGLEDETQITVDTGRSRSFGDQLRMRGVGDYYGVASMCNRVYRWQTDQIRSVSRPATFNQLLSIYENHPELSESMHLAASVVRQVPVNRSVLGLAHWLFDQIDEGDAEFFFDRLRDGQGLTEGDPIFALRKAFFTALSQPGSHNMSDLLTLALVIKAWNAYRRGDVVSALRWRAGGAKPEPFPTPV